MGTHPYNNFFRKKVTDEIMLNLNPQNSLTSRILGISVARVIIRSANHTIIDRELRIAHYTLLIADMQNVARNLLTQGEPIDILMITANALTEEIQRLNSELITQPQLTI